MIDFKAGFNARTGVSDSPAQSDEEHAMQVRVETYVDKGGVEKLHRFRLDGRQIEIAENIDQWHGADHRYFKIKANDGDLYILRHDEILADWELIMYEHTQSQGDPAIVSAGLGEK